MFFAPHPPFFFLQFTLFYTTLVKNILILYSLFFLIPSFYYFFCSFLTWLSFHLLFIFVFFILFSFYGFFFIFFIFKNSLIWNDKWKGQKLQNDWNLAELSWEYIFWKFLYFLHLKNNNLPFCTTLTIQKSTKSIFFLKLCLINL
jgi:hypothetical protein